MKQFLLSILAIVCLTSLNAQVTWNQLSDIPANADESNTAAKSADVTIADDGRIYTSFIWNDGSKNSLYIKEYKKGIGWVALHSEEVFDGFKPVRSASQGNSVYVLCKTGNAALSPLFKLYKVFEGQVFEKAAFNLSDINLNEAIDFEVNLSSTFACLLHRSSTGTNMKITSIDIDAGFSATYMLPVSNLFEIKTYDMAMIGDTAFVGLSAIDGAGSHVYLHKMHSSGGTPVSYMPKVSPTGEVLYYGSQIKCNNLMLNDFGNNFVYLTGFDLIEKQLFEFKYHSSTFEFLDLQPGADVNEPMVMGATASFNDRIYFFSNFAKDTLGPYNLYVNSKLVFDGIHDTIGGIAEFPFVSTPSEHRLSGCAGQNRLVASYNDVTNSGRKTFVSNNLPTIDTTVVIPNPQICKGTSGYDLFQDLNIVDLNADSVRIVQIVSSDNAIIEPSGIAVTATTIDLTSVHLTFTMTTPSTMNGEVQLGLVLTDGWDTVIVYLPKLMVQDAVTTMFTQIAPICQNTTPPSLAQLSDNNVSGTWEPSEIATDVAGIFTYTFTPDFGTCATSVEMEISINAAAIPQFPTFGPYCVDGTTMPLPLTATNSVSGFWTPAQVDKTVTSSDSYTFTPDAGVCAETLEITIVVDDAITPTFDQLGPYCLGESPDGLASVSNNDISGTWSPATITTTAIGSTDYTFTPTNGQCVESTVMTIEVNSVIEPEFSLLPAACQGVTAQILPTTSDNGLVGNWSPSVINTSVVGQSTYTFTPQSVCGDEYEFTITIIPFLAPSFNTQNIALCSKQSVVDLNDYVTIRGGIFSFGALGVTLKDGKFDTDGTSVPSGAVHILTYTITNGLCSKSATTNFKLNVGPVVSMARTPTSCGARTGTATATITGGATPYSKLEWSSGQVGVTSVTKLGPGEHTFKVTDDNSCSTTSFFNIQASGASVAATVVNVSCAGGKNGEITLVPTNLQAPLQVLWSSGHSTLKVTGLDAGNYSAVIRDANNCEVAISKSITEPKEIVVVTSEVAPNCQQSDGSMKVVSASGGTAPYTYAWSNGDTGTLSDNNDAGIYSLTTTDSKGCTAINTVFLNENSGGSLVGVVKPTDCGASVGSINVVPQIPAGETVASIVWSNGATTEDISGLAADEYICTLELSNGCKIVRKWEIPVVSPLQNDICIVTVDSTTSTNLVVWEKVQPVGVAYYNIYRETSVAGSFKLIDTVEATNISIFNDVVASPLVRSWRYKISAVNACLVEGPLSKAHQTVLLRALDNGSNQTKVTWNAFSGNAIAGYKLSRYTPADGWSVVATLPITQLSFVDNIPVTTVGLDYLLEMELDEVCTAQLFRGQDFNSGRSNKQKGQFLAGSGTGDSNNDLDEFESNPVVIYPNPTNDVLYIEQGKVGELQTIVYSIDGQKLMEKNTMELTTTLSFANLARGVYILQLSRNGNHIVERIIVE